MFKFSFRFILYVLKHAREVLFDLPWRYLGWELGISN